MRMASCAACDLRLLHWNLQQRVASAAATEQLSAVLAFARAHRYDVVSLNELALEQAQGAVTQVHCGRCGRACSVKSEAGASQAKQM